MRTAVATKTSAPILKICAFRLRLKLARPIRKRALFFKAAAAAHVELNDGDRRRRLGQAHTPNVGALFDDEVDTKLGCIADADACAEEQVAQHAAPRLLAAGCCIANQPTAPKNTHTRVPQQNCLGVHVVEQARRDARHNVRAEGAAAAAGVARSKLQLVHQIGERAGVERFCHLGLQTKAR